MKSPALARAASVLIVAAIAVTPAIASPRRTKTKVPKTPTPTPTSPSAPSAPSPKPATLVPDPPYVGTPTGAASSYAGILEAKEAGATEAQLLELVAKEGKRYTLSTPDIQKLRAAGVSSKVIEAMMRSGRTAVPVPTAAATAPAAPTPTPR